MATIAVTGSTGHLGRLVVEKLLQSGVEPSTIIAVARTPARAADLAERGVQVRAGDYSDPASLPAALAGVDTLLLVSGSELGQRVAQHTAVIEAAKAAGVGWIVYTSAPRADVTDLSLAAEHKATEEVLAAARVPFTVLRINWYHENYTAQLGQYLSQGFVLGAAGDGRIRGASRADFAAGIAKVLTTSGHDNAIYEFGGTPFTLAELAATITEVTGTTRHLPRRHGCGARRRAGPGRARRDDGGPVRRHRRVDPWRCARCRRGRSAAAARPADLQPGRRRARRQGLTPPHPAAHPGLACPEERNGHGTLWAPEPGRGRLRCVVHGLSPGIVHNAPQRADPGEAGGAAAAGVTGCQAGHLPVCRPGGKPEPAGSSPAAALPELTDSSTTPPVGRRPWYRPMPLLHLRRRGGRRRRPRGEHRPGHPPRRDRQVRRERGGDRAGGRLPGHRRAAAPTRRSEGGDGRRQGPGQGPRKIFPWTYP